MIAEQETGLVLAIEILVWSVPALLALWLAHRAPTGTRVTWLIVGVACAAIVGDKIFDMHQHLHALGSAIATALDPETRLRGPRRIYRIAFLAALFVGACAVVYVVVRRDRALNPPKLLSLVGVAACLALGAVRIVPGMERLADHPWDWLAQGTCWAIVVIGEVLAVRQPGSAVRSFHGQGQE